MDKKNLRSLLGTIFNEEIIKSKMISEKLDVIITKQLEKDKDTLYFIEYDYDCSPTYAMWVSESKIIKEVW